MTRCDHPAAGAPHITCDLAAGHDGMHARTDDEGQTARWGSPGHQARRGGPSGRTLTRAQRQARGDVQVAVWLDSDDARILAELEAGDPGEGARTRIVRRAIRLLAAAARG